MANWSRMYAPSAPETCQSSPESEIPAKDPFVFLEAGFFAALVFLAAGAFFAVLDFFAVLLGAFYFVLGAAFPESAASQPAIHDARFSPFRRVVLGLFA